MGFLRTFRGNAGARRLAAVAADVPAPLPHRARPSAAQPALLGRLVSQYRRAEPDTTQHEVRAQDSDDHLSRHRTSRPDAVALGHRQLDTPRMRKVGSTVIKIINTKNCSLSIVLTATDQKPQKSLKR